MGFPSTGLSSFYRNSLVDTRNFLDFKHPGHYKIYNLCIEKDKKYEAGMFENGKFNDDFNFYDHNPPPFEMIFACCSDIHRFLLADKQNVVAIHCKAGKGRTGVIICCYLIFSRYCKSAYEALVFYGKIRTRDGKGVTIPSQIRYVYYFDHFMKWRETGQTKVTSPPRVVKKIYKIRIITVPNILKGGFFPNFQVACKGFIFYDYNKVEKDRTDKFLRGVSYYDFVIKSAEVLVYDDVRITFFNEKKKAFQFWFNTWFIDKTGVFYINKDMID